MQIEIVVPFAQGPNFRCPHGCEVELHRLLGDKRFVAKGMCDHFVILQEAMQDAPKTTGWECLYAGLDTDGILKIFTIGPDGRPKRIDHQHWLDIRAARLPDIEAGEMPIVSLRLEKKKEKRP